MRATWHDQRLKFEAQLRQDPDRIHEVIRELESALQTYELTKVKYADDEDLETSFYDEEHM